MLLALLPLVPLALAAPCGEPVPVYRDGAREGEVCAAQAAAAGLTVIDLADDWTPAVFAPGPDGDAPAYRATYLALAAGRLADAGHDGVAAAHDGALEVYGVLPTFTALAARLDDDARHACHAAIGDRPLAAFSTELREEPSATGLARIRDARELRARLERERGKRELADLDALAAVDARHAKQVARLRALEARLAAIIAAQAHLRCEGLLAAAEPDGRFGWRTGQALTIFQRRHALVPRGRLDADTRALLAAGSPALDHRAVLRALRERVIAATGLVEDGSAGDGARPVLGLLLDPPGWSRVPGHPPLANAAPDLVAPATEAAARALGWLTPAATARALRTRPPRAAVALPPLPAYHAPDMPLAVEIDRGDVWYDPRPRWRRLERRPALVLSTIVDGVRVPLVRWPTTIGGWQDEKVDGSVVDRWKESPVGPRVWRLLHVGPTWLPPDTTPDRELVDHVGGGRYQLDRAVLGPSYRSAYGLVMFVHERVLQRRGVTTHGGDQWVRTHGSGNVASIFDGHSHGCHRLLPPLALRLAGFVVAHRAHVRRGEQPTRYVRTVRHHGTFRIEITTRGYLVELTPPIPVDVLPGRIRSPRKTPPR